MNNDFHRDPDHEAICARMLRQMADELERKALRLVVHPEMINITFDDQRRTVAFTCDLRFKPE